MNIQDFYASFVNLDHRTDRMNHMEGQLQRVGLKAVRTRGLLPHEVIERKIAEPERVATMFRRTQGAIGCHFSQVSIIEEAFKKGKSAIVFEDDIIFCQDFNERLEYIFKWMDTHEWDVFYLGSAMHLTDPIAPHWHPYGQSKMRPDVSTHIGQDAKKTDDPRILQTYGAFDTFAYMVNFKSIPKVLEMLDKYLSESIGIDHNMIYWQPRGMNSFAFLPGLVRQMTNMSDIGNGITNWDNFLQLGPFVFQERMEMYDPSTLNIIKG